MKKLLASLALTTLLSAAPAALQAEETSHQVVLHTSLGEITLTLDAERAPATVANFERYVKSGFYDGLIFHRVIDGFMIQGGGFTPEMVRQPTNPPIRNEADNGLLNRTGTVAMARTGDPHSATAQFFINVKDNPFLNHRGPTPDGWGYAVFGQVIDGMEVVKRIKAVPTTTRQGFRDVPVTPVVIERAELK